MRLTKFQPGRGSTSLWRKEPEDARIVVYVVRTSFPAYRLVIRRKKNLTPRHDMGRVTMAPRGHEERAREAENRHEYTAVKMAVLK